jgi:hypothetical protein
MPEFVTPNPDIPTPDADAISRALWLRQQADEMEKSAEVMKKAANAILRVALITFPRCTYTVAGIGTAQLISKLQPSFSQAKLREYLALQYSAETADAAVAAATTVNPIQYVMFTRDMVEGGTEDGGR